MISNNSTRSPCNFLHKKDNPCLSCLSTDISHPLKHFGKFGCVLSKIWYQELNRMQHTWRCVIKVQCDSLALVLHVSIYLYFLDQHCHFQPNNEHIHLILLTFPDIYLLVYIPSYSCHQVWYMIFLKIKFYLLDQPEKISWTMLSWSQFTLSFFDLLILSCTWYSQIQLINIYQKKL